MYSFIGNYIPFVDFNQCNEVKQDSRVMSINTVPRHEQATKPLRILWRSFMGKYVIGSRSCLLLDTSATKLSCLGQLAGNSVPLTSVSITVVINLVIKATDAIRNVFSQTSLLVDVSSDTNSQLRSITWLPTS